jgi:hypothetical protein
MQCYTKMDIILAWSLDGNRTSHAFGAGCFKLLPIARFPCVPKAQWHENAQFISQNTLKQRSSNWIIWT